MINSQSLTGALAFAVVAVLLFFCVCAEFR